MALLPVTGRRSGKNKQVIGHVVVDDDLLPILQQYAWTAHPEGYAYRQLPGGDGVQFLHYFVWEHHHGQDSVPEDLFLDHRNQDKRDNRITNLEIVDARVKQANAPKRADNTSGYKDVSPLPNGRFSARVRRDYDQWYVGCYPTALEAAYAVNIAYEILHPEVPTPNLIPQDALTDEQMAAIEDNVHRLLRPDRQPHER
jgi:hypothetical protein